MSSARSASGGPEEPLQGEVEVPVAITGIVTSRPEPKRITRPTYAAPKAPFSSPGSEGREALNRPVRPLSLIHI